MLSVAQKPNMLSVVILSVVKLNVVMLSVVMLNVVTPNDANIKLFELIKLLSNKLECHIRSP